MNQTVMGVMVTYNPDIGLLSRNLVALLEQVAYLEIYDNGSENCGMLEEVIDKYPTIQLYKNNQNLGLPINYNKAARTHSPPPGV